MHWPGQHRPCYIYDVNDSARMLFELVLLWFLITVLYNTQSLFDYIMPSFHSAAKKISFLNNLHFLTQNNSGSSFDSLITFFFHQEHPFCSVFVKNLNNKDLYRRVVQDVNFQDGVQAEEAIMGTRCFKLSGYH